ncbi:hypothetical protein N7532_004297 [Penicillium argentinense]|uniref:Uncharacterized protein n=1 Tax=Penicillium argentinense TaxID=1131581 RepID=A0A9W9KFI3_9EURO|nr:uncharacterized protein N7532_004297 [Penicillium argentinense]KAJ5103768.1 hypothetical protein N7532_004297 [Penicillium argentinense]
MGNGPLERKLKFEKKNQDLVKLPKCKLFPPPKPNRRRHSRKGKLTVMSADAKVEKRPIPHAPIASPYAGASVPKIVYVSSNTPFMSAVKRVQKLLLQAEKRATANISLGDTRKTEQQTLAELAKAAENREEVFVKATGRAIEKALNVGKWFQEKETEYNVRVNTGSVLVVDDVVEDEEKKVQEEKKQQHQGERKGNEKDVTEDKNGASKPGTKTKKRKRQEAPAASEDAELPESRTRWIKMVEVAVSLK